MLTCVTISICSPVLLREQDRVKGKERVTNKTVKEKHIEIKEVKLHGYWKHHVYFYFFCKTNTDSLLIHNFIIKRYI